MQSLWARAGQAHRCGCRACSTAVGTIGRRATAVGGRRKATFAEIFTACYSSVFATAAIVDAVRKDDRRRELDRQLEEARRELNELQERSPRSSPSEASSSDLSIEQMDSLWRTLKTIYQDRPYMKELHKPAAISASELISNLKADFYKAVSETSLRAMRKTNYERLERAIMAEELDGQICLREPRNYKQLLQDSSSTEQLVQQLLRRAEILDNGAVQSPSFDEARQLASNGLPNFSYPSIDPERAQKNTSSLNSKIRDLVGANNLSIKEKIGRICYNLLVSAYPPGMHTYNTLIVALDKSGQHALSDAIVHSFFHQRLMRPTPSTYAAILNHYKSTGNHGQFLRAISCLTGLDTLTGAKIKRRHINDVDQIRTLQKWAADTKRRTRTGQWVWEHGPLRTTLIETILDGLLHFKLFADAASLFVTCVRSRVALNTRTITHLFDECVAALDWKAAVKMVRGLLFSLPEWEFFLSQRDGATAAHLLSRTSALIDLCGLGRNEQGPSKQRLANLYVSAPKWDRFLEFMAQSNVLLPESYTGGFRTPRDGSYDDSARAKRRLLQIESIWKEYELVRKTTASIESKLLYPDFSISFRASMALHIGVNAMQRALKLCHEAETALPSNQSPPSRRRQVTSHAAVNARDDFLIEDMDSLTVVDEHLDAHPERSLEQDVAPSMVATGWARKQVCTPPKELGYKPGGLLAWSQQSNRAGTMEGKHWAFGSY